MSESQALRAISGEGDKRGWGVGGESTQKISFNSQERSHPLRTAFPCDDTPNSLDRLHHFENVLKRGRIQQIQIRPLEHHTNQLPLLCGRHYIRVEAPGFVVNVNILK